ncbi:unnamed protein product, partial [Ascophyllum nodosum]
MKEYLMDKDKNKRSLLSEAAISGNKGLFETVLTTVKAKLLDDQVKDIVSLRDKDDHSLLFLAVGRKSEIMFSAALTAVSDVGGDDEVKEQLKVKKDTLTGSVLANAALS